MISPLSTIEVASIDLLIGDAPALHHARRHAQRVGEFGQLRAAAVHHDDAHAEVMQDRDLLDQRARQLRVAEHGAAGLDDEDLALVETDVGRGAAQRADRRGVIGSVQDHVGRGYSAGLSNRYSTAICAGRRL